MIKRSDLVIWLSNIDKEDEEKVGKEAANLGEMVKLGIPFPSGFVITTNAYREFLLANNLLTITKPVRKIKEATMSKKLINEIFRAYKRLESPLKDATVDISSTFLKKKLKNVKGEANLIQSVKSLWSLFFESSTNHYLSAIVVQKKISPFCSGIMFTTDQINNDKTKITIKEEKSGNHYEVLKKGLKISSKNISKGKKQLLSDKKLIEVAKLGVKLQKYYYFPQEVHFAIEKNKIYITQTKPLTTFNHQMHNVYQKPKHNVLLTGKPFYPGIATGHLRIIQSMQDIDKILRGEIIVIPYQDLIKRSIIKAGAIVATDDRVHHMSHLTLGRFFSGKPALITTPNEAKMLKNGAVVTVNGKSGELHLG